MKGTNRLEDFDFPEGIDLEKEGKDLLVEVRTSVGVLEGDADVVRETSFCEGMGAPDCYTPPRTRAFKNDRNRVQYGVDINEVSKD